MIENLRALRRRLPRVTVETGPTLPGWALRLAAALLPALLVLAALVRSPVLTISGSAALVGLALVLTSALALSVLRWPSAWQPLLAVLATAVAMVFTPDGRWWALALAPLGYVAYRVAVLSAEVPWSARVERSALGHAARTDVLVIGVTWVVGALGLLLDGDLPAGIVVGAAGVLGLAWWLRR